jgi:hypothetical protein
MTLSMYMEKAQVACTSGMAYPLVKRVQQHLQIIFCIYSILV